MTEQLSIVTDFGFDEGDLEILRAAVGDRGHVEHFNDIAALRRALPQADVLCTSRPPADLLAIAPHLRWLQYPYGGIDTLQRSGLIRVGQPLRITTISSVIAGPIAEYVTGAMLIFARKWDEMFQLQARHEWATGRAWGALRGVPLENQTVGIVGLGAIGRRVARLGRAYGMRVLGLRRKVNRGEHDPDCDELFQSEQLLELLEASDYVVVSVPLTQQTTNLLGARELRAMHSHAYLINVARGEVIQESALIRALQERWIAGAALDVVVEEPLPSHHPLWSLPGVLITPHLSGLITGYTRRVAEHFADNLGHFVRGELPLLDEVDPADGY